MAKAIIDKLPFPLKELRWERLPEVAAAAEFAYEDTFNLMKLVLGDPPQDLEPWHAYQKFVLYFAWL